MHPLDSVWETINLQFEAARAEITKELNQVFRRLRQYQSEAEWASAVLDAASHYVRQLALFSLQDGVLSLRCERNLQLTEDLSFAIAGAGAFQTAIDSKDRVVALRTSAEIGESLSSPDPGERAHIVPILNGPRVVALLFAANEGSPNLNVDVNALELIAGLASTVLERRSNADLHTQIESQPVQHSNGSAGHNRPSWAELPESERALHVRAQRFARVKTAEMQLASPDACRAGREQGNLYVFLRQEIDSAREAYRKQFMSNPSMIDYLHLELIRAAANGDEQKLGAEYPGQLV